MKKIFKKLFKKKERKHFYPTDVWSEVADKYGIKEKLWHYTKVLSTIENIGSGVVLYGEVYGPGIQKNYDYGLKDIEFAAFDITVDGKYQNVFRTAHVVANVLHLPHVPELYVGPWSQEIQDKYVFNNFVDKTKIPHEGIVVKHVSGERNKIAKVINPDYLIYGEKHDVGDSH